LAPRSGVQSKTVRAAIILALAASVSGCHLMWSANVHHNSRGSACVETPAFAVIDLVIAGSAVAGISAGDEHPGYYAIPGLIALSGIAGIVESARCGETKEPVANNAPPASNSAPSFGEAEVDPDARPATAEEIFGVTPVAPVTPIAPAPTPTTYQSPKLKLDNDYNVDKHKPPPEEKIACGNSPSSCPPGMTCAIAGGDAGYCVATSEHEFR
jgi:hypothetical protein